ncbi:MAG: HAMP domain-containing histidine kinase [Defluviitaleaceae bacterium]|nr:HAMP domain-containing histidine kinase [Defluviitaleaceae bacterium]
MKKFKFVLMRNFFGMIFVIFWLIYFSFNILTNNFITEEARRELSSSAVDIATGEFASTVGQIRAIGRLMMNTDVIIVTDSDEIIYPPITNLSESTASDITLLTHRFTSGRDVFEMGDMRRVLGENGVYYLIAMDLSFIHGLPISALLYTDITSAVMFMHAVNRTLGLILIISGVLSAVISFFLSSNVQKAVDKLRKYADVIGHGNFREKVEDFKYEEFNDLAQSMNTMSNMLETYENNQKKFFQNVSHELRTPLVSIQGYAEGIAENILNKDEAANIIVAESLKMETLISQILYVSRMDSGLDDLEITTINVKSFLYDGASRIKILADKNGKELAFKFPEGEIEIKTDEEKLQRAIDNILSNCIRHADTRVTIGYEVVGKSGVVITITDDGGGISDEDMPNIFDRFYKGVNGNSGLGLAIAKDVVEKLGGSISAENAGGARFAITLR